MLQLLATISVTTAEAERLFAKLQRALTVMKSSTAEDRLEARSIMQIHRSDIPPPDAVIDRFADTM
jgi:hypothetical protein